MTIDKIKKKYCTDDKVQLMLSNAPSQIILSADGYLYLREGDIAIHRYLIDPIRNTMPYGDNPSSDDHATHLFKYDKIYAKFTRYRNMGGGLHMEDSYSLTFLYFVRAENGEAFCAELSLKDFESEEETTEMLSKSELENFLYDINGADAKCIFEWFGGIQYVKHSQERIAIANDNFLNLSEEAIIKKYNFKKEPMYCLILDDEERAKRKADESWKAHSIKDVKNFVLTHKGILGGYSPILLVIEGNEMSVYEFTVTFIAEDCFELKSIKRRISLNYNDILRCANNCGYTQDPTFEE